MEKLEKIWRINKACPSYPCHVGLEDCTFCYCPFYPCLKELNGGRMIEVFDGTVKKKIWDCSGCNLVHKTKFVDGVFEEVRKLLEEMKIKL